MFLSLILSQSTMQQQISSKPFSQQFLACGRAFVHIPKSIISKVTTKKGRYIPWNNGKRNLIVFCPHIILFYRLVEINFLYSRHMLWYIFLEGIDHRKPSKKHQIFPMEEDKWQCAHISRLETNWFRPKNVAWRQIVLWNNDKSNTLSNKKAKLNLLLVQQSYNKHFCIETDERTKHQFLKFLMSSSWFQHATADLKYLSTKRNQFINHQNYSFMPCIKLSIFRCNLWHFIASWFHHFHILQTSGLLGQTPTV